MDFRAEWLTEIDAELESLGASPDEIAALLGRFAGREPDDLAVVDAQLEDLAAGVSVELPEPAPRREPAPKREPKREPKRGRARDRKGPAEEPIHVAGVADAGVDVDFDPDDMPTVESADRSTGRLSEEDLFGDTPSDEPPAPEAGSAPKDYSYLFGPDSDLPPAGEDEGSGDALLDSLEREIESFRPPPNDDADGDPTNVFSSRDLDAIERDAFSSSPPPRPARPPSQSPPSRDPDFDALLGDDESVFRPSQHPPGAEAAEARADDDAEDFELLVDEDLLVEVDEDPLDDLPSVEATLSQRPPPPGAAMSQPPPTPSVPAAAASQTSPPPEGEDDEEPGQKKGFFKKLFGGKE